ncbi:MAG: GTPase [Pirellulaceae bacterium]
MSLAVDDTIAAIATAAGRGLRGIVRLSGPSTRDCLEKSLGRRIEEPAGSESVRCRQILFCCPTPIGEIPCQLYLWPLNRSYTRQESAEIHLPGSTVLLDGVLEQLCRNGARLARPGEFTLRAFLAGRIDLTQAEAVLGVIHASGEEQLDDALRQLAGGLATPLQQLRADLLDLLAELEAGLDFVEDDIRFISPQELDRQLEEAQQLLLHVSVRLEARRGSETDYRIVIAGAPNVGKSTLFNRLAESTTALVSSEPGTTRDYLSCQMNLGDARCLLIDTAGLDSAGAMDAVSQASQHASGEQQQVADLVVFCIDGTREPRSWEREFAGSREPKRLVIVTKSDQPVHPQAARLGIPVSSHQGEGLLQLQEQMERRIAQTEGSADAPRLTATRCQQSIQQASQALLSARQLVADSLGEELVAAEVRSALDAVGEVTGEVYTDEILDRIFTRFCIGK